MFENYSIETASRHPSSLPLDELDDCYSSGSCSPFQSSSPSDTTSMRAISHFMDDLPRQFSRQQLSCFAEETHDYTYAEDMESLLSPSRPQSLLLSSPRCIRQRLQRQRDVRSQCDPAHLRSISALVERMVENGEQCGISPAPSQNNKSCVPLAADIDEGYESPEPDSPRSISTSSSSSSAGRPTCWRQDSFMKDSSLPSRKSGDPPREYSSSKDSRVRKSRHIHGPVRDRR